MTGGNPVVCDRGFMVSGHLQQVGADRGEAMMSSKSRIAVEHAKQFEPFGWAVHHNVGDGLIEHDHGIVGHGLKQFV